MNELNCLTVVRKGIILSVMACSLLINIYANHMVPIVGRFIPSTNSMDLAMRKYAKETYGVHCTGMFSCPPRIAYWVTADVLKDNQWQPVLLNQDDSSMYCYCDDISLCVNYRTHALKLDLCKQPGISKLSYQSVSAPVLLGIEARENPYGAAHVEKTGEIPC